MLLVLPQPSFSILLTLFLTQSGLTLSWRALHSSALFQVSKLQLTPAVLFLFVQAELLSKRGTVLKQRLQRFGLSVNVLNLPFVFYPLPPSHFTP